MLAVADLPGHRVQQRPAGDRFPVVPGVDQPGVERLDFAAPVITAIQKKRWRIDLFFKALYRSLARTAGPAERHAPRPGGGARRT